MPEGMTSPSRGDLVEVTWVDIYEDATGNPDTAKLARRITYGLFWEERLDGDVPVLVTTTTLDKDGPAQQGYCIYPRACVVSLKVIKRARRRKNGSS